MRTKSKERKLKKLYIQLGKYHQQPITRTGTVSDGMGGRIYDDNLQILTRRGRIENKIQTLEHTK